MENVRSISDLEERLSRPTQGVLGTLSSIQGNILVLGAGGKMGPSLSRMIRRGMDELGQSKRHVIAVSRFSSPKKAEELTRHGVQVIACDLLDREAVSRLPDAQNIIFMAGQKFGTSDAPEQTWMMNTVVPAIVAERYGGKRTVVFSTGCVYAFAPVSGTGSKEEDPLQPPGEYANSCVGRERIFAHYGKQHGTPITFYRLSYANDLRYGVLVDVAQKVWRGETVDVSTGEANVIWQGDANARAIQCLAHASNPAVAVNVTGMERVAIRSLAQRFAKAFDVELRLTGEEGETAWIFDASRSYQWFGPPEVSLDELIEATAHWVKNGGASLDIPTHFEARDGQF